GIETWIDNGVHRIEVDAEHFVPALDEHVAEILLRSWGAVRSCAAGCANQIVAECRDPPGRPERVVVSRLHVGGGRRLRPPRSGIAPVAFDLPDGRVVLPVRNRLPWAERNPKRDEPLH